MARKSGRTLGAVIDAALRRELSAVERRSDPPAIPVFRGGTGPRPGVDLESNRALQEALDEAQPLDSLR